MENKIDKAIVGLMMVLFLAAPVFSLEPELNLSIGRYAKADDYLVELYGKSNNIPCAGAVLYLTEKIGIFIDVSFMSARAQSTMENKALEYKENHFTTGLQYRYPVYRFSPDIRVDLYLKAGGLFLRYSETFEETFAATIPGFCFGGGAIFRLKKLGVGFEALKNFAYEEVEIQGLDMIEKINFSGFRFSLKGTYSF